MWDPRKWETRDAVEHLVRTSSLFSTTHHLDRIITADYLSSIRCLSLTSRAGLNVLTQKDYFKLKNKHVNMCIHICTFTWASVLSICRCPQLYILLHSFLIHFLSRLERLGFWLRSNFSLKTNLTNCTLKLLQKTFFYGHGYYLWWDYALFLTQVH